MYNSESTIQRTLNSVIDQLYDGTLEIIVVDDGSTDHSREIVEKYIADHLEFDIKLVHQLNGGSSKARNQGIRNASYEWVALLDSDDEWLPNKLKRQVYVLQNNPHIDFLGSSRNGERFNWVLWKKLGNLSRVSPKMLMVRFVFVVPTIIFKKEIVDSIGFFDENQRYSEEGNYFIRIAQKFNCYLLNESLVITGGGKPHFGHSGLSGNLKEMEKGELKNIRDAWDLKIINRVEYYVLSCYSLMKYFRRVIIVKMR